MIHTPLFVWCNISLIHGCFHKDCDFSYYSLFRDEEWFRASFRILFHSKRGKKRVLKSFLYALCNKGCE